MFAPFGQNLGLRGDGDIIFSFWGGLDPRAMKMDDKVSFERFGSDDGRSSLARLSLPLLDAVTRVMLGLLVLWLTCLVL